MMNKDLKILYVEDNLDIVEEIQFFLQMHTESVITANNGEQGLEMFKKHQPNIIITDIQMPVMNGIDMILKIRELDSQIPIIITTAFNDSEYLSKAIDLQVNGYILKPIDLKQLQHTMQKVYEPFALKQQLIEKNKEYEELNKNLEYLVDEKTKELKKNIAFLNSYKFALDISSIVSKTDKDGIITYVNDNFCKISGYEKDELIGQTHKMIRSPQTNDMIIKRMWEDIITKKRWQGIIKNQTKDQSHYWVDLNIVALLDDNNNTESYIAISTDLTKTMDQKEMLYKLANVDNLTGLFNRNKLIEDLDDSKNCLALININKFRQINDFYGFEFGDNVIIAFANFLSQFTQKSNFFLYRLHGDEFALLSQKESRSDMLLMLNTIIDEVSSDFIVDEKSIRLDITISVSFERGKLLKTADTAKREQKNIAKSLIVYDKELQLEKKIEDYLIWLDKIKTAHKDKKFIPYFQPIVNNQTLEWEKAETLVRLVDENNDVYSPFFFLDIAKQTKHYIDITKSMIKGAFSYFKDRDEAFSINLSVKDILDHETQFFIINELSRYKNVHNVIFEIEESEGIESYDDIISFIESIKSFGCKIAIDDFGSGYSNFEYLLRFKADFIKIDGSLIKDIATSETSKIVVKNIVRFAQDLGIKTIAEFVENKEIFDIVKEMGVDYSQGYYFSKPMAELKRK